MTLRRRHCLAPAALGMVLALSGCGSTITGEAVADSSTAHRAIPGELADLLLGPGDFSAPYEAVVLPPTAMKDAGSDLDIVDGAEVDPPECGDRPGNQPSPGAIIVGTASDAAKKPISTITIGLTRTTRSTESLATRRDRLDRCPDVTVTTMDGVTVKLRNEVTPAPPIDADDTLAVKQTATSGSAEKPFVQELSTLSAQVGDVVVEAVFLTYTGAKPDMAALDQLFTDQVTRIRAAE